MTNFIPEAESYNRQIFRENTSPKYELIPESKSYKDLPCWRIRALRDFGKVRKGDIGGYVAGPYSLSHEGNCWIADDAVVGPAARIENDARIGGSAAAHGLARVFGNAVVEGRAVVRNSVQISGNAYVGGNSYVCSWAKVRGNARVDGFSIVSERDDLTTGRYCNWSSLISPAY